MTAPGMAPAELRPAALVILARDGEQGLEVFMLQRTRGADFVPGANVFPGGGVDADDGSAQIAALSPGLDDAAASRILGIAQGGLAFWAAAVRECFEEAGLLLATDASGELVDFSAAQDASRYAAVRGELNAGRQGFAAMLREHGLTLALDRMAYFSHWITPMGMKRRYDTRFFVAAAPAGQVATHDEAETVDSVWIRPSDALALSDEGKFTLVYATRQTLQQLAGFASVAELMAHACSTRSIAPCMPRIASSRDQQRRVVGPQDAAYVEIGLLDPEGHGRACCEIVPGRLVAMRPGLWRLTAANPGYMTGPGTNTYFIGDAEGITVIDPGPLDDAHIQAILALAPGPITQVLVTHTHSDHSPAAAPIKAATGATVLGLPAPVATHDQTFAPDRLPVHGERIETRAGVLRVLHTPGHASNHLCYLHEAERILFTGDHIMQGSTVVISPPDGDMKAYLDSLTALLDEEITYLAPAHGYVMGEPRAVVGGLIEHRLRREALILRFLQREGPADEEALLPKVYSHVVPPLKKVAARSLHAHLLKLQADGKVALQGGRWAALSSE
nr:MBL fold metallo-hydrolase [Verticiella sediminum]